MRAYVRVCVRTCVRGCNYFKHLQHKDTKLSEILFLHSAQ